MRQTVPRVRIAALLDPRARSPEARAISVSTSTRTRVLQGEDSRGREHARGRLRIALGRVDADQTHRRGAAVLERDLDRVAVQCDMRSRLYTGSSFVSSQALACRCLVG